MSDFTPALDALGSTLIRPAVPAVPRARRSVANVAASDPATAAALASAASPPVAPPATGDGISPIMRDLFSQLSPAMATMSAMVKDGADAGAFDDTDKMNAWLVAAQAAAAKAPSVYELQAKQALTDSKASQALSDYERANPTPRPQLLTAQQYPQLQLPEVPTNVQPRPNGVASLGAGIAGLIAPQYAGRFASEALSGAIAATARENDLRKQQYQLNLQQSLLKHQDEIRQADAQAEVDAQNARANNTYTAAQHSDNLKAAVDSLNAAKLSGEAGNLSAYAQQDTAAKQLQIKADQLGTELKSAQQDAKDKRDAAIRASSVITGLADHMLTIQGRSDALKQQAAKQAQDQQNTEADRAQKQQQIDRQGAHDKAQEDIQRSHLSIEDKNSALRALEIQYTHQDRQDALKQKNSAEGRASVMHHETPEELSAKTDMEYLKGLAQAAMKTANANPQNDDLKRAGIAAQAEYNKARKNYQDIGNAARDADRHRLPGMPAAPPAQYRFNPATGQVE